MKQLLGLIPASLRARSRLWAALLVCILVLVPYAQVRHFDFVNFDDVGYVTQNDIVQQGLTWKGVRWAFTTFHFANWHPLTWLFHMADVTLFDLNPAGHHITNLFLHLINTVLVLFLADRLLGSLWAASAVSLLFGIHPLHVESVAWISERKDLLSGFFWFLALIAWLRYRTSERPAWYLGAFIAHALGLMCKPMGVTLPVILLLLAFLANHRQDSRSVRKAPLLRDIPIRRLFVAVLPFFALSTVSSVVTVLAQSQKGALMPLKTFPFVFRLENASVSYLRYLLRTAYPTDLAFFYPPFELNAIVALLCGAIVLSATIAAVVYRRRTPLLSFCWLWYVITLLPVIGIIQVGVQASADRYTYIPLFGIFVLLADGAQKAIHRWPGWRTPAAALGLVIVALLLGLTQRQVSTWKDSEALCTHALSVTQNNFTAHNNLGGYLNEVNRPEEAIPHLMEALRLIPNFSRAEYNLALSYALLGDDAKTREHFDRAVAAEPNYPAAFSNIGKIYLNRREYAKAVDFFLGALERNPNHVPALFNMAMAQMKMKQEGQAIPYLEKVVKLDPKDQDARLMLCIVLAKQGRKADAAACLEEAKESALLSSSGTPAILDMEKRLMQAITRKRQR